MQTDDFVLGVAPDASGPDFFLYDMSWLGWVCGNVYADELREETGIEVEDIASLREAFVGVLPNMRPWPLR